MIHTMSLSTIILYRKEYNSSCIEYFLVWLLCVVLHKPCQPQISPNPYHTSNYVSFSWTGCSRDKVAPALDYLVSCADYLQIQRSTSKTVYGLRPNKWYSCSVYGIDTLGRLGGYASFSFRTSKIGRLLYAINLWSSVPCSHAAAVAR